MPPGPTPERAGLISGPPSKVPPDSITWRNSSGLGQNNPARSGMNNGVLNIEVDRIGNVTVCRSVGESHLRHQHRDRTIDPGGV